MIVNRNPCANRCLPSYNGDNSSCIKKGYIFGTPVKPRKVYSCSCISQPRLSESDISDILKQGHTVYLHILVCK